MKLLTCQEAIDYLTEYLAGNLPPEEHSRLDQHLVLCPECVAYLRNFQATIEITKRACREDASVAPIPEQLLQAILAARSSGQTN